MRRRCRCRRRDAGPIAWSLAGVLAIAAVGGWAALVFFAACIAVLTVTFLLGDRRRARR